GGRSPDSGRPQPRTGSPSHASRLGTDPSTPPRAVPTRPVAPRSEPPCKDSSLPSPTRFVNRQRLPSQDPPSTYVDDHLAAALALALGGARPSAPRGGSASGLRLGGRHLLGSGTGRPARAQLG